MKTLNLKYFGVTILIFRGHVTSSERNRPTLRWWPCDYLARIRRNGASKILGSRVWPFGGHVTSSVTWSFGSHMWFLIGRPLEPCVYFAPLRRYKASKKVACICPC